MLWPIILASLGLSAIGAAYMRPALPVMGALLSLPLAWYLLDSPLPLWETAGAALPLLHLAAALAVRRRNAPLAWVALTPVAALTGWLAITVLAQ